MSNKNGKSRMNEKELTKEECLEFIFQQDPCIIDLISFLSVINDISYKSSNYILLDSIREHDGLGDFQEKIEQICHEQKDIILSEVGVRINIIFEVELKNRNYLYD